MGGMVSGAIYLAAPFATVGPGASAEPQVTVTLAGRAAEVGAAARWVSPGTVPDLPVADWSGRIRQFRQLIADDVHRELTLGPVRPAPMADEQVGTDVDGAVVAEHDARIASLRRHLADSRAGNAVVVGRIGDLRARLHRAEAARELAIARAKTGERYAADGRDGVPLTTSVVAVRPDAGGERLPHPSFNRAEAVAGARVAARSSGAHHPLRLARKIPAGGHPTDRHVVDARFSASILPGGTEIEGRPSSQNPQHARHSGSVRPEHLHHHPVADGPSVDALRQSRRLLAEARRALEGSASDHRPVTQSVAMLPWKSSPSWSLADIPKLDA